MFITPGLTLFILALPVLVASASLLLAGQCAAPGARQHAAITMLAASLLTALGCLLIARQGPVDALTASQLILTALAMLGAFLIAAPLLDRARQGGLLAAALPGGLMTVQGIFAWLQNLLPTLPRSGLLLALIIITGALGLAGSAMLRAHPARLSPAGQPRLHPLAQAWLLAGLALLALTLAGLAWLMEPEAEPLAQLPLAISSLTAALACLLASQRRHPHPLRKAGEGLVAGVVLAVLCPPSLAVAVGAGLLAAFLTLRGETIALALRLDDPLHQLGMLLLPAMAGLLLPGLLALSSLAAQLQWLGACLAAAGLLTLLLWPLSMLLFGLAASPRRIREGLDNF